MPEILLELRDLGLPDETVAWLKTIGLTTVAELALHFAEPRQQELLVQKSGLAAEEIADVVRRALRTLPADDLTMARRVANEPRSLGAMPPPEEFGTSAGLITNRPAGSTGTTQPEEGQP